jgi:hypothetical protein
VKIELTSIYVVDQDQALSLYTGVLEFVKTDFTQETFRWLTVASPEEPDRAELQLALNDNPAAKVTGSTIAMVNDNCGNLIQITALDGWQG